VLDQLVLGAPGRLDVRCHGQLAVALEGERDGGQLVTLADGTRIGDITAVVLAQGHIPMPVVGDELVLSEFAGIRGLTYVPPDNPAEVDLTGIRLARPSGCGGWGCVSSTTWRC